MMGLAQYHESIITHSTGFSESFALSTPIWRNNVNHCKSILICNSVDNCDLTAMIFERRF